MIRLSLFAAVAYLLVCPAARAEPIALRELTVALADRFWETTQINKPARLGAADLAQKISLTCGGRVKFVEESAAPTQGPVLYLGPTGPYYKDCDGFEKDPNWFEFWASANTIFAALCGNLRGGGDPQVHGDVPMQL